MVKEIPKWLESRLSGEGLKKIETAVKKAESSTSGEIVPMIVLRSSTTGHVAVITFCILFILFMCSGLFQMQVNYLSIHVFIWWILDIATFSLISSLLSRFHFIQRHLTSSEDIDQQVSQRAELEFYEAGLNNTSVGTGILIFLSLMERKVVVLADKAISDQLDKETWHEMVELLLSSIKENDLTQGFTRAIERCGELLAPLFPIAENDRNELRDRLVIKE